MDGCAIVEFTMSADSLADVAHVTREAPWGRCRSAKQLRVVGHVHVAAPDELLPSSADPGTLYWLSDEGWRRLQ